MMQRVVVTSRKKRPNHQLRDIVSGKQPPCNAGDRSAVDNENLLAQARVVLALPLLLGIVVLKFEYPGRPRLQRETFDMLRAATA